MTNSFEEQMTNLPGSLDDFDYAQKVRILGVILDLFLEVISEYDEKERQSKWFDRWNLQELLAHFIGWNELTIADFYRTINGEDSVWVDGEEEINKFNESEVQMRKELTWNQIYSEFTRTTRELTALYCVLTPAQREMSMRKCEYIPISSSLTIDIFHFCEHLNTIIQELRTHRADPEF